MHSDALPERVRVREVGPRDGFQNEPERISTADKIRLIEQLARAGFKRIEVASFVRPDVIPQLDDAIAVLHGIAVPDDVSLTVLVPNARGLDTALEHRERFHEVAVFLSASETHNKKNVNKTIAETLRAFEEVVGPARAAGARVRAYVSTVYGCPYEGDVDPRRVVELTKTLREMGVYQVSLGDTIGVANPAQVERVLEMLLAEIPREQIAMHMHDTRGTALANCLVGLGMGITTFDSSVGGLGGCPYAPGASGNLATEDLVACLHAMGIQTGVDLEKLVAASQLVAASVGRDLPSRYLKAHLGQAARLLRKRS